VVIYKCCNFNDNLKFFLIFSKIKDHPISISLGYQIISICPIFCGILHLTYTEVLQKNGVIVNGTKCKIDFNETPEQQRNGFNDTFEIDMDQTHQWATCDEERKIKYKSWLWAWSAYAFFLPILIISVCYGQVLCKISDTVKNKAPATWILIFAQKFWFLTHILNLTISSVNV